ncbi:6078_t:CDS:2, partial [Acaulospora colombiana]
VEDIKGSDFTTVYDTIDFNNASSAHILGISNRVARAIPDRPSPNQTARQLQSQFSGVAAVNQDWAWIVFVNRAVYRFFAWTCAKWMLPSPGLYVDMMPPLDVIM